MMAQSGRDPLMWAALAVANQDAPHSGETCLRCHLPKGWLEGRSAARGRHVDDAPTIARACSAASATAWSIRSRTPGEPAEDAAILAALAAPVPTFGNAMMVVDPLDRRRGPFDIVADLGSDPHAPRRPTLVSPFHRERRRSAAPATTSAIPPSPRTR